MSERGLRSLGLVLTLAILATYLSLPTKMYFWDGISFALTIEDSSKLSPSLIHPNHLVYTALGYCVYKTAQRIGLSPRALDVLRITNSLLSALCAYLLFRILLSTVGSPYLSCILTLLFSFSAIWWRFSTDANAYIPSVFFLLVSFWLVLPTRASKPALVAVMHTAAMLLHQLAIFFCPVVLLGIFYQNYPLPFWRKLSSLFRYSGIAFSLTLCAYCYGFYITHGNWELPSFLRWVTSHSPEVSFSFDLGRNLFHSVRGNIRLFQGGRLSLFVKSLNPITVGLAFLWLGLLTVLCLRVLQNREAVRALMTRPVEMEPQLRFSFWLALTWVVFYVVFLFFWLPQKTFYRLFYLPAIILLVGVFLAYAEERWRPRRRYRLALLAAAVALSNLTFYILPYSRIEANPPLSFALQMGRIWSKGAVVYYDTLNSDDQTIKYFNPSTKWKKLNAQDLDGLENEVEQIYARGGTAWFDTTSINLFLSRQTGLREWLAARTKRETQFELISKKHRIQFFQIFPHRNRRAP